VQELLICQSTVTSSWAGKGIDGGPVL
jgi:hypothetical protein